ncbi:MAG TPA: hypothetical protein V6C89_18070 [Drouetiella sp.]
MDVVFEGRLTDEVPLKSVLQKIVEKRPSGNLLLRVATPDRNCDGKICIVDGRFITAAIVAQTRETGYDAVRKILSVTEGNFACLRPNKEDSLMIPYSLNIELDKILPLIPNLPDEADGLHDEKSLLDKVFGAQAFEAEPPIAPVEPKLELVEPVRPQNPNASWQLLEPLAMPGGMGAIPSLDASPVQTAPPPKAIEPVNADDLAALNTRTHVDRSNDDKIKPGKRVSVLSPMLITGFVGLMFVAECLAIVYWKQINVFIVQQTGGPTHHAVHKASARH